MHRVYLAFPMAERPPETRVRRAGPDRSRCTAMLLAILVCLANTRSVTGQAGASNEYQVKAAFLFHFAQFVEWPPETFKDASTPLTYCTIGDDPFHGALDLSLSGKTIGARPTRVQHFKQPQEIHGCQILFIGAGEKKRLGAAMANVKNNPVLTVGETDHFIEEGGMIGFFVEEDKIRFEINLEAAELAKLKISSRLVALARRVINKPEPRKS
jgi:hypothetical protein